MIMNLLRRLKTNFIYHECSCFAWRKLHILNYEVDQQYKAHYDYFAEHSRSAANNRISTLVMYLNDVEEAEKLSFRN